MLEAAAFLLLGLSIMGAILYLLTTVTRLATMALETQARLLNLENEADLLRDNLDSAVEAMSFEIDSLRKRCDVLEND